MALSAFDDPVHQPTADEVAAVLGAAAPCWATLVADVRERAGELDEAWHFGGPRFGWSLRLVHHGRNLAHLTPMPGRLLVGLALGEQAIAAAEAAGRVSARTRALVAAAPRYAEGRGIRLELETDEDLDVARELAAMKLGR